MGTPQDPQATSASSKSVGKMEEKASRSEGECSPGGAARVFDISKSGKALLIRASTHYLLGLPVLSLLACCRFTS
jgi:hypothetical protein